MAETNDTIHIRQAGPEDADAVCRLMIASMRQDREWWDYRFPHREDHPADHSKFIGHLAGAWISPELDNWAGVLAECWDGAAGQWEAASYAAWDLSYLKTRRLGAGYKPASREFAPPPEAMYVAFCLCEARRVEGVDAVAWGLFSRGPGIREGTLASMSGGPGGFA